jgi:hypothetical protein
MRGDMVEDVLARAHGQRNRIGEAIEQFGNRKALGAKR